MASDTTTQYFTFTLDGEDYALEISKVREVLDYTTITRVPRVPPFMLGVINLRGNVVPVIDMRLKLGLNAGERTVETCIVIVEIELEGETVQMGSLADSVKAVIDLSDEEISPPPRFGARLNSQFIKGMGKQEDGFLIILDIDRVLSLEEQYSIQTESNAVVEET